MRGRRGSSRYVGHVGGCFRPNEFCRSWFWIEMAMGVESEMGYFEREGDTKWVVLENLAAGRRWEVSSRGTVGLVVSWWLEMEGVVAGHRWRGVVADLVAAVGVSPAEVIVEKFKGGRRDSGGDEIDSRSGISQRIVMQLRSLWNISSFYALTLIANVNEEAANSQMFRIVYAGCVFTMARKKVYSISRPSFPTKKRVQVPQYPPSETLPPTKLVGGNSKSITNDAQKPLVTEKDWSELNEKGEPVLSPFFWLREQDVERSTEQTDGDFIMDTPPDAPCFSDIKDSDDGVPCEMSPKQMEQIFLTVRCSNGHRACSSELCSSPFKAKVFLCGTLLPMSQLFSSFSFSVLVWFLNSFSFAGLRFCLVKTKDTIECAGAQEKAEAYSLENANEESVTQNRIAVASERGTDKGQLILYSLFPPENETTSTKGVCKSSRSKALRSTKKKLGKKVLGAVSEVHNNSQIAAEQTIKNNQDNANAFNSKKKKMKTKRAEKCGEGSVETFDVKTCHKRRQESLSEENKYCFRPISRIRTGKYNNTQAHDETSHFESANRLVPMDNDGEATPGTEMNICELECDSKLLGKKKVKFTEDEQHVDKENITLEKIPKRVLKSLETEKSVSNLNELVLRKCEASHNKIQCAFCHSVEESEVSGVMLSYLNGKPVKGDANGVSGVINVHKHCAEWTTLLCYALYMPTLSFHVMSLEKSLKIRESIKRNSRICQPKVSATPDNAATLQWKSQKKNKNLVLCCSALTADEKNWDLSVTHVIASTDEKGACRRTLKYLMGVLAGKWILSTDWIIASLEATEFVEEQQYEIKIDTHGIVDGPKFGRLRVLDKQPKLFNGYKFFFMGDFLPSYKSYLHDLVIAAGGIALNRKPVAVDQEILSLGCPPPFVIYSHEQLHKCDGSEKISILAGRRSDAQVLASSTGAVAASNLWILNCIVGSKLLELE
ncbi:hypothetical protein RND71_035412 [Anisodus tanguticus]|uniref:BRCT domain-containing protein n=1 Tax=Anisodus tanguticus TaxID=243964 RepID=A0AAE1UZR5_9SOLA|nr:hypothetical protein RND71_035412 [Anisodus tanguticus]